MKYTIQKMFQQLGYKKTYNIPSKHTAVGRYAYLMFENISKPSVTNEEACAWIQKHKQEIITKALEVQQNSKPKEK